MLIDYNSKNSVTITCKSNEKIQIVHTATGLFVSTEIQDTDSKDVVDRQMLHAHKVIALEKHKNKDKD